MAERSMTTPHGTYKIWRPDADVTSPLRAWSAADQLVLDHLGADDLGRVLVVNDEFGALSCGLAHCEPLVWSDSVLSRQAIDENLQRNGLPALDASRSIAGNESPTGRFDTVVYRIPKVAALLEFQLDALSRCVDESTRIVGTAMARHIHTSTLAVFEARIGPTTTSRATRKARLVHPEYAPTSPPLKLPGSFITDHGIIVEQMPGTFSAGHVDPGSALLLQVLAGIEPPHREAVVLDLGCGNGVLGATMAAQWTHVSFVMVDVSDLAVAAAQATWEANGLHPEVSFRVADGLSGTEDASIDLVLTNPPFHQGHAVDAGLTDRLLGDMARVLAPEGEAYVVAQRHLNLHTRLLQWFESAEVISKHPSHVVVRVQLPKHS